MNRPWRAGLFLAHRSRVANDGPLSAVDAARTLADHVARVADVSSGVTRVVQLALPEGADRRHVSTVMAERVQALGYVPVSTGPHHDRRDARLGHRHVAVFVHAPGDAAEACDLVRRLARTSDRAHVVIDLRTEAKDFGRRGPPRGAMFARERAPAFGGNERRVGDPRFDRAVAFLSRNRGAAGERWLRAALESARRRNDEPTEARAACRLIEELTARDQWQAAKRLAIEVCDRLRSWSARLAVGVELARVLIAMGELTRADTLLASVEVEATLRREPLSRLVRVRRAEVRFWHGRFEEARDLIPAGPAESLAEGITAGLIAWAVGDEGSLREAAQALARRAGTAVDPSHWGSALDALSASLSPTGWCGPARVSEASHPRLVRACLAEAWLARGRSEEARAVLGVSPAGEACLEEALLDRLRAACAARPDVKAPASPDLVRREGARGLLRWGLRRTGVHLLHAVPALLQIVHDAEDEVAALQGGCAWVRSHVGADAAGLVTCGGGTRLIAGEALGERDLGAELVRDAVASAGRVVARGPVAVASAPVRFQGVTIGLAIVLGRAEMGGSLAEGAELLASMCAPALRGRLDALALAGAGQSLAPDILGDSPAVAAVRDAIARAAGTPFPVLIEGESGTGKELAARALHRLSVRRDRRLSAVNCAALSDELVEAELFGYARGAFTGAVGMRPGLFEEASGSTLLLDEVSELSARAQAKLLRALQEREIRRLGENVPRPVDVRVLSATNRPLADEVGRGRFREDLMFRLAVVKIRLPALRERVEDIPRLAHAFWRRVIVEVGKHAILGADALAALSRHGWPGNVRELQNVMAGLALAAPARGRVSARHVAQVLGGRDFLTQPRAPSLEAARRSFERQLVAATLARNAGRRTAAARELGLTRQGLAKAMKRLGVDLPRETAGVA
jgi:DNA-binding NtrC family response regulator